MNENINNSSLDTLSGGGVQSVSTQAVTNDSSLGTPPNTEIWYTSTDGKVVTPKYTTGFGATILTNTYENGKGVITFDADVTSITNSGFSGSKIACISFPECLSTIGNYAFSDCENLLSIYIPKFTTSLGTFCFTGCSSVENIIVESGNTVYDSRDNCNAIIKTETNTLISGCKNTIIPSGILGFYARAFENCSGLTSIVLPDSIKYINDRDFRRCKNLSSVTFSNSLQAIYGRAFEYCSSLQNIIIPNSVTSISEYAFNGCDKLTSINIPKNITYIGDYALSVGNSDSNADNNIETITVDENNTVYDSRNNCNAIIKTRTNELILGCKNTIIPNSVTIIGKYAFDSCKNLSIIDIPNSVTSINDRAFINCQGITTINIPDSVETIGYYAFSLCKKLKSIVIPDKVTTIQEGTFNGCETLTSITIGSGVTSCTENGIFQSCKNCVILTCKAVTPPNATYLFHYVYIPSHGEPTSLEDESKPVVFSTSNNEVSTQSYEHAPNLEAVYVPKESVEAYKAAEGWSELADYIQAIPEEGKAKNFLDLSGLQSFWKNIKTKFVSSTSTGSYLKIATGSTQSMDINQDRVLKGTTNTGTKLVTDGYVTEQISENTDKALTTDEVDDLFYPILSENQVYITCDDFKCYNDGMIPAITFINFKIDSIGGFKSIELKVGNYSIETFTTFPKTLNYSDVIKIKSYDISITPTFNGIPEIVDSTTYILKEIEDFDDNSTGKFSILLEWKNGKWTVIK